MLLVMLDALDGPSHVGGIHRRHRVVCAEPSAERVTDDYSRCWTREGKAKA